MRNNGTWSTTEPQRIKRNTSEAWRRTEKKTESYTHSKDRGLQR